MKYWLCIFKGEDTNSQEQYEEYYPIIGSLFVSKKNEKPPMDHNDDQWVEISQEEYEKAMNDENYIIKYDGVHCIGKCTECQRYISKKHICEEDDHIVKDQGVFKNCCIFKD